jgi:Secretory lipase
LSHRFSRARRVLAVATVVVVAAVASATIATGPAQAATSQGATEFDFYKAPSPLPKGAPGQLIRYTSIDPQLGTGAPAALAWTVMYHSRTERQADAAVTGSVLIPTRSWTGAGQRPIVMLSVGTQGLGAACAPSRQLVTGDLNEVGKITKALERGWGVVVTDYAGYTTGSTPSYLVGPDMARAALDAVRAARQVPGTGLTKDNPVVSWGYSQGGRASAWATVIRPTYAPDVRLIADASGGIPADLSSLVTSLNGGAGAGFALAALAGLQQAYPAAFPLADRLNAEGLAAIQTVRAICREELLTTFLAKNINTYFKPGFSLAQLLIEPQAAAALNANLLTAQTAPAVPTLQWHGIIDEIVPVTMGLDLHRNWCNRGVTTRLDLNPGEHVLADNTSELPAVLFLADALAGKHLLANCAF